MYRKPPRSTQIVSLRELHRSTGNVVRRLEEGGEPFVITKHGRPVGVLFPCAMNAPVKPVLSLVPSLPIPEGIQLPIFQVMDDTPKTTDQVALRLGLPSMEVGVALSRLELSGHIRRATMGYCLSAKGIELAEWMQEEA